MCEQSAVPSSSDETMFRWRGPPLPPSSLPFPPLMKKRSVLTPTLFFAFFCSCFFFLLFCLEPYVVPTFGCSLRGFGFKVCGSGFAGWSMVWWFWAMGWKIWFSLTFLAPGTSSTVFYFILTSWTKNLYSLSFLNHVKTGRFFFFSQRGEFRFKIHIFRAGGTPILAHVHRGHTKEMVILSESRERANGARRGSEAHPEQRITGRGLGKSPEMEEAQVEIWTTMRQELWILFTRRVSG